MGDGGGSGIDVVGIFLEMAIPAGDGKEGGAGAEDDLACCGIGAHGLGVIL